MDDIPGVFAVTEAFRKAYSAASRLDFRSHLPPELEPHPAKLVTAWEGPGYWHLVTCGLTELFRKESDIPEQSGWGMELTMKVPRAESDPGPPRYAVELLRYLVNYVESSHKPFQAGHYADIGPLAQGATLEGVTFVRDTRLSGLYSGPFGRFYFLQVVGVTRDELEALARVDDERVVRALARQRGPDLLTEPLRASVFSGPQAPPVPQETKVAAGSMQVNVLRFSRSFIGGHECELDVQTAPLVARLLAERLGQNHPLQLSHQEGLRVEFRPAPEPGWSFQEGLLTVKLSPEDAQELCAGLAAARSNEPIVLARLPDLKFRCVWG